VGAQDEQLLCCSSAGCTAAEHNRPMRATYTPPYVSTHTPHGNDTTVGMQHSRREVQCALHMTRASQRTLTQSRGEGRCNPAPGGCCASAARGCSRVRSVGTHLGAGAARRGAGRCCSHAGPSRPAPPGRRAIQVGRKTRACRSCSFASMS